MVRYTLALVTLTPDRYLHIDDRRFWLSLSRPRANLDRTTFRRSRLDFFDWGHAIDHRFGDNHGALLSRGNAKERAKSIASQTETFSCNFPAHMLRIAKWTALLVAVVLALCLGWHVYTEQRDLRFLKIALGVTQMPSSARNVHIKVSNLFDKITEGYLELTPDDFAKILRSRKYSEVSDPAEKKKPLMLKVPSGFTPFRYYRWFDGTVECTLSTNSSNTELAVAYEKHWW